MAREAHGDISETSSWITKSDQDDIADEVERACTRLQDAIRDEKAARESLESLFKKRREDASDGVKKAQRHLEFVHEEEERLRKTLLDKGKSSEIPTVAFRNGQTSGNEKEGTVNQDAEKRAVLHSFFQGLLKEKGGAKTESAAKEPPSRLERYISEEEAGIRTYQISLNDSRGEVEELPQLIARLEEQDDIVAGSPGSESTEFEGQGEIDGAKSTENDGPTEGDIALLKKRLKQAEGMVEWKSTQIQGKQARIDSYRRLLAASLS